MLDHVPALVRVTKNGVTCWTDSALAELGVLVAFSERSGGESHPPFRSLNLAGHVGDDPSAVDENRLLLLDALGISETRSRLVTAQQVHGEEMAVVGEADAGRGAYAASGRSAVAGTDALVTKTQALPLLMCFADCVPVVLVAPGPVVAVIHAGWRGALSRLPGKTVEVVTAEAGCEESDVLAYIGPHIGACCYEVGEEILSQFCNAFGTVARAKSGGLDLEAVVRRSLSDSGVVPWRITSLGVCTAEATERFFSYRAEGGTTGRHGALACVLPSL